ncbi:MAG: carboxypeptidase-like regulatory domain-containing protein, partial [Oligoflexus sp.]|nr:carboxypeptidase-like regulatory domain-containing protein [Pseudopedobacter sp.]
MFKKLFFILLLFPILIKAQNNHIVKGIITNEQKEALEGVRVKIQDSKTFAISKEDGAYQFNLKSGNYIISFSLLGYKTANVEVKVKDIDVDLSFTLLKNIQSLKQVVVQDQQSRNTGMISIDPKFATSNPNISQSFESILKQLPGVSTNNELSSQYSVRGGNFDENLIYINDIEIYKPYLVRNGQQEGLSLINPDLVGKVKFSAGGFTPKYGDKLSSVLDVQYKNQDSVKYTVGLGTNGVSATGFFDFKKLSGAVGFRNKQNKLILNSQPVVGAYNPQFYDLQGLLNYQFNKNTSLNFLGIYNNSKFGLIPQSRETSFGTFNQLLRLSIDYEGQEKDEFSNQVAALTLNSRIG